MVTADQDPKLASERPKVLTHPALLLVDSWMGTATCRALSGATLFAQIVNRCYELAATVLTSNKSFDRLLPLPRCVPKVRPGATAVRRSSDGSG